MRHAVLTDRADAPRRCRAAARARGSEAVPSSGKGVGGLAERRGGRRGASEPPRDRRPFLKSDPFSFVALRQEVVALSVLRHRVAAYRRDVGERVLWDRRDAGLPSRLSARPQTDTRVSRCGAASLRLTRGEPPSPLDPPAHTSSAPRPTPRSLGAVGRPKRTPPPSPRVRSPALSPHPPPPPPHPHPHPPPPPSRPAPPHPTPPQPIPTPTHTSSPPHPNLIPTSLT